MGFSLSVLESMYSKLFNKKSWESSRVLGLVPIHRTSLGLPGFLGGGGAISAL